MINVWSNKKSINIVISILVYLMAINFLHYGQLLLPIICLIMFIDNKAKFYVHDIKIFIVLCLFAVSFCAFSYQLGFYCVMGFTLPMAYYIGSNIKEKSENGFKKALSIIILGMISHYLLNLIYEFILFGFHRTMVKSTRYDIWLQGPFVSTGTATNSVLLLSLLYYLLFKEKNKNNKVIGLILFVPTLFYTIILRRRTQIGIFAIVFVVSLIVDLLINKNKESKKIIKKVLLSVLMIIICFCLAYFYNLFGFKRYIDVNSIIAFSIKDGLNSGRFEILQKGIKYLPKYLWGGQIISTIIGNPFHDLLLNIYDYAGIVTMLLMFLYIILAGKNIYRIIKSQKNSIDFKLLVIEITLGYIIMFFLEPLMTGSSLFLIVGILIEACLELLL